MLHGELARATEAAEPAVHLQDVAQAEDGQHVFPPENERPIDIERMKAYEKSIFLLKFYQYVAHLKIGN